MAPLTRWVSPKLVKSGLTRIEIKLVLQAGLMLQMRMKNKLIMVLLMMILELLVPMMLVKVMEETWENA